MTRNSRSIEGQTTRVQLVALLRIVQPMKTTNTKSPDKRACVNQSHPPNCIAQQPRSHPPRKRNLAMGNRFICCIWSRFCHTDRRHIWLIPQIVYIGRCVNKFYLWNTRCIVYIDEELTIDAHMSCWSPPLVTAPRKRPCFTDRTGRAHVYWTQTYRTNSSATPCC